MKFVLWAAFCLAAWLLPAFAPANALPPAKKPDKTSTTNRPASGKPQTSSPEIARWVGAWMGASTRILTMVASDGRARVHLGGSTVARLRNYETAFFVNAEQGLADWSGTVRVPQLAKTVARLLLHATSDRIEGSGTFDCAVHDTRAAASLHAHQWPTGGSALGSLFIDAPLDVARFGLNGAWFDGNLDSSWQALTATIHVGLSSPLIPAYIPIQHFSLDLRDRKTGWYADVELTALTRSFIGLQLAAIKQNPNEFEQNIKATLADLPGVTVKQISVQALPEVANTVGVHLLARVTGVRSAIRQALQPFLAKTGRTRQATLDLNRILALTVHHVQITLNRSVDTLVLGAHLHASNIGVFATGYLGLYPSVMEMLTRHAPVAVAADVVQKLMQRASAIQFQQLAELLSDAALHSARQTAQWEIRLQGVNDRVQVNGSLTASSHTADLSAVAARHHYPLLTRTGIDLDVRTVGERIRGTGRLDLIGPWVEAERMAYAQAATTIPELASVAATLQHFALNEAGMEVRVGADGVVTAQGAARTTRFEPVLAALATRFIPITPEGLYAFAGRFVQRGPATASHTLDLYYNRTQGSPKAFANLVTEFFHSHRNTLVTPAASNMVSPGVVPTATFQIQP